jgi:exonuclease VII large subunit
MATDDDEDDFAPWEPESDNDEIVEKLKKFQAFVEDSHRELHRLFTQQIGQSHQRVLDQFQAGLEKEFKRLRAELSARVDETYRQLRADMAKVIDDMKGVYDYLADHAIRLQALEAQQRPK